jgi:hypothetical protein
MRIMREIQGGPTKVMRATGEILGADDDVPIWDLVVKVLTREGYFVRALPRGWDVL